MPTIALSTGEAELGATTRGAAESEGVLSLLRDFGLDASLKLRSDASAAIGITQRLGLGKVRHLSVADLWAQERARAGSLRVVKIDGHDNPADLMTKGLTSARIKHLMGKMDVESKGAMHCEAEEESDEEEVRESERHRECAEKRAKRE